MKFGKRDRVEMVDLDPQASAPLLSTPPFIYDVVGVEARPKPLMRPAELAVERPTTISFPASADAASVVKNSMRIENSGSMSLKEVYANLGESVAVGAVHVGYNSLYSKAPLDARALKQGAMATGAALAGDIGGRMLLPMVLSGSDLVAAAERQFLAPVLSGAAYVAADEVLKIDNRAPLMKFLVQGGSHLAASTLYLPLRGAITGKAGY